MNKYPKAIDDELIGKYPALVNSGGGYFFDEVLEYRVWCHPESGSPDEHDGNDYYYAFCTFEEALDFSNATNGAEKPLVLIRQHEYIDEPSPGEYIHLKEERLTEWRVEWLSGGPRQSGEIEDFIEKRKNG